MAAELNRTEGSTLADGCSLCEGSSCQDVQATKLSNVLELGIVVERNGIREKNVSKSEVDDREDGCRGVENPKCDSLDDDGDDDDDWKTSLLSGTSRSVVDV